jgi:hypothetical protein
MTTPIELSAETLAGVTGGNAFTKALGKAARFIPGVNIAMGAVDAYDTYSTSRSQGKGIGDSLADATTAYLKDATYYDVWGPTPAY